MKTLFDYTRDRQSGRWIARSEPLRITLDCDSKEEMVEAVSSSITSLLKSARKHGDTEAVLAGLSEHLAQPPASTPATNNETHPHNSRRRR